MIIGISGKIGSGKDTVARMIQNIHGMRHHGSKFKIIRFADKVKEIVAAIIGVTVEQLENREFKTKPLGSDWLVWRVMNPKTQQTTIFNNSADAVRYSELIHNSVIEAHELTPRDLLILVGTESGRKLIHPNIWVNITIREIRKAVDDGYHVLVPDLRFLNELEQLVAIGGQILRVERIVEGTAKYAATNDSETSLDNYPFDNIIKNNSTLSDLNQSVTRYYEQILNYEKTN